MKVNIEQMPKAAMNKENTKLNKSKKEDTELLVVQTITDTQR